MITSKTHPSVTVERVMKAVEAQSTFLENPGLCLACGEDAEGCEPDARNYKCEVCGENQVFGAEEILMMITI